MFHGEKEKGFELNEYAKCFEEAYLKERQERDQDILNSAFEKPISPFMHSIEISIERVRCL